MSKAALKAEVVSLRTEVDRLQRALTDVNVLIMSGRLTGELPDNFFKQFSKLPDGPLEQVLRFLPARQVVQMRHVSRRFNELIKKSSKTMPKKVIEGGVMFKRYVPEVLVVEWFDDDGKKVTNIVSTAHLESLSELLRFVCIDDPVFFGEGLSAADGVLEQLSKPWLTIRPEFVVFSGDLSETSSHYLKSFLVKVEPYVKQLHFQHASNIGDRLLSDEVIGAAGWLDGLMVLPKSGDSQQYDICIGDETLRSMVNGKQMPWYFVGMGCAGFTLGGIRAFVEKWIKNGRSQVDPKSVCSGWEFCELTFYKCANVTPATVEEACGDLLKKEAVVGSNAPSASGSEETGDRIRYNITCTKSRRQLDIRFNYDPHYCHLIEEPGENSRDEEDDDDDDNSNSDIDYDDNSDPDVDFDDYGYEGYDDAMDYYDCDFF